MCDNANTGGNQPDGHQIKKMKFTHAISNQFTALSETEIKVGEIQWDGNDSPQWRGDLYIAGTTNGTVAFYGETNGDDVMLAECDGKEWVSREDSDGSIPLLAQLANITWEKSAPEGMMAFIQNLE